MGETARTPAWDVPQHKSWRPPKHLGPPAGLFNMSTKIGDKWPPHSMPPSTVLCDKYACTQRLRSNVAELLGKEALERQASKDGTPVVSNERCQTCVT